MNYILDSSALIAFLNGESGANIVQNLLDDPNAVCYAHAVNICEVYYGFFREKDQTTAEVVVNDLISIGLQIREDMDQAFWQAVGHYKVVLRRVALADCFCLALAQRIGGDLVTADHHEFDPVDQQKIHPIIFIR
jgi:PIN domain nuclease of toxin-antitoxin system